MFMPCDLVTPYCNMDDGARPLGESPKAMSRWATKLNCFIASFKIILIWKYCHIIKLYGHVICLSFDIPTEIVGAILPSPPLLFPVPHINSRALCFNPPPPPKKKKKKKWKNIRKIRTKLCLAVDTLNLISTPDQSHTVDKLMYQRKVPGTAKTFRIDLYIKLVQALFEAY